MQYIIIYHSGGKKWITEQQALQISRAMDNPENKFIDIGNETKISISSISQVLSEREYKEQYPDKETGRVFKDQFKQLPEPQGNFSHSRAINQMRKALADKLFIN